jgi:simple sugar transport system permease protein
MADTSVDPEQTGWYGAVLGRASTVLIPLATVALAFIIGGLVVVIAGANPFAVYKDMWVGAGFDWPFQFIPGNPIGVNGAFAETNLISTLVVFTPLVLTGLAVAFAFRCGLFNIGGTGQYWVGSYAALLVAVHVTGIGGSALATIAAAAAGAVWAAIPGALKAFRGAHEVISTIMLNYIAINLGQYLYGLGGPLQDTSSGQPVSQTIHMSAAYKMIWGDLQGVHVGIFIALAAAVVFWLLLNRTTLGYEVRAVGLNPDAARYGGVSVRRSIVVAMAISGAFAGLAGAGDTLGIHYVIASTDISATTIGFTGIAVALLGRNTAVGVVLSALLFAALSSGARNLTGAINPELAGELAQVIQGVIILLVGGEAIVRWVFKRRHITMRRDPEVHLPSAATGQV